MELGATVCRPRRPACGACPVRAAAPRGGRRDRAPPRPRERFEDTDRWARGRILAALVAGGEAPHSIPTAASAPRPGWSATASRSGARRRAGGARRYARDDARPAFTIPADALEAGSTGCCRSSRRASTRRRCRAAGRAGGVRRGAPSRAELEVAVGAAPHRRRRGGGARRSRRAARPLPPGTPVAGRIVVCVDRRAARGRGTARRGDRLPRVERSARARTRPRRCAWS